MIPGEFDYHAATSVEHALSLLAQHGDDAKLLAGGQSLIPAMRYRLATPEVLIDISRLDELRYIEEKADYLAIGAMTQEWELEESEVVQTKYPLLADTAHVIADPLVRNLATVGGNIAHSDPANDHPATMLAYGATVVARGPGGERSFPIDSFFTGLFENALADNELLTEIRIPRPTSGGGGSYIKVERKVGDYAISAVAANLVMDGGVMRSVRVGLTNVSPVPMRAQKAETLLEGNPPSEEVFERAGAAAAEECEPSGDLRGSEEYKRDLTRVLFKRAVKKAVERAS
ncbi:MAG: xanthine dehydrogenase family protein subunit M [Myxococcota bacterium]